MRRCHTRARQTPLTLEDHKQKRKSVQIHARFARGWFGCVCTARSTHVQSCNAPRVVSSTPVRGADGATRRTGCALGSGMAHARLGARYVPGGSCACVRACVCVHVCVCLCVFVCAYACLCVFVRWCAPGVCAWCVRVMGPFVVCAWCVRVVCARGPCVAVWCAGG